VWSGPGGRSRRFVAGGSESAGEVGSGEKAEESRVALTTNGGGAWIL